MEEILLPQRVTRGFIQKHPEWIFVYSDSHFRNGAEGMAWNFAGEPNAFCVTTCYKLCKNSRYFFDSNEQYWQWIKDDIAAIPRDGRPIIVMPRIGYGCSRMREFAPKLFEFLWSELDKIKYKNVKIVYAQ